MNSSARWSILFIAATVLAAAAYGLLIDDFTADRPPQILKANIVSEPQTLDPRLAYDVTSSTVIRHLYEGITRLDQKGVAQLALAEKIEIDESGTEVQITLRKALWENGDPITAQDFWESWTSLLEPTFPGPFCYRLFVIKNAQAVKAGLLPKESLGLHVLDERTLLITLEEPTPHFLALLSTYTFFPLHRETLAGGPLISSGPFFLASWAHDREIRLQLNGNYWDAEKVELDEIRFAMVERNETELSLYEQGELHWAGSPMGSLPSDAIPWLEESGELQQTEIVSTYFYKCNTERFPLSHPKIRRALWLATDCGKLNEHILHNLWIPAKGVVQESIGGEAYDSYDPEIARRLFQEALAELNLTVAELPQLTLAYSMAEEHHKIAQAIQQDWREVLGWSINLNQMEYAVLLSSMANNQFDIAWKTWLADYPSPQALLEPFLYRNGEHAGANNDTRWQSIKFVDLIKQQKIREAEQVWMDDLPALPLFHVVHRYVKAPSLKGVVYAPVGHVDFKEAYFE